MAKDKDLQLQMKAEELAQQLLEIKERTKEVTQQFENAAKVADDLVQKIREGSQEIDDISEGTLRWKVGLQKLSKQMGFINDQVVDHSKHLIQIKQQYSKLSNTAKQWLSSVNFGDIVSGYKTSLTEFRGMFFSSFARMSNVALGLAKNFTELGQQGFNDVTDSIRSLDQALLQASNDYSLMFTKVEWDSAIIKQMQLKEELSKIAEDIDNIDKTNQAGLNSYVQKITLTKQLQQELQKQNKIVKQGRIVTDQVKWDAKAQLDLLKQHRDVMYDMNKLQLALNEKLKPYMESLDQSAQKLNSAKEGFSELFTVIGIDLVGIQQALSKIDFKEVVKPLKTMIATTTMQFALGFKAIRQKGIRSFKDIAKSGHGIFRGLVGGIGKMFFGLFSMLALGLIAAIGAMVTAAIRRSQQLAQAFNSAQQSAGALNGEMSNFRAIYNTMGGQLGGQKAAQLYNTMLKLKNVTVATAKQAQLLQRSYAVSVTDSAGMLQNMRNIFGMSQATSNNLATVTAQWAVQRGMQPQKIFTQLANLSGETLIHLGGSTKHMMKTLMFANRLNLTMQDMASTAAGLNDIQGSIQKAMQLQALTGKQIDIGQILRLKHSNKPGQAMALMMNQLGDSINSQSPILAQKIQEIFGFDIGKIRSAWNQVKNNGGDAFKILNEQAKAANGAVTDAVTGNIKAVTTSAYALQTPFQAIGRRIQNIILKHFRPVINYILSNAGGILTYFEKFVAFTAKITMMFIKWLQRPQVQMGIADFFKKAYEFGQKLLNKVVIPIFKFLVKVYEKGGFVGLLGLFTLVKVLLNLPSVIKGMKGIFGIFGLGKKKVQEEAIQTVKPKKSGKSNFSKAFDGVKGLGKITGQTLSQTFEQQIKKTKSFVETIKLHFMYMGDSVKSASDTVKLKFMYMGDRIKDFSETVKLKFMYIGDGIKGFADTARLKLMYLGDVVKQKFAKVGEVFAPMANKVKGVFDKVKESASKIATPLMNAGGKALNYLSEKASKFKDSFAAKFAEKTGMSITAALKKGFAGVADAAGKLASSAGKGALKIAKGVGKGLLIGAGALLAGSVVGAGMKAVGQKAGLKVDPAEKLKEMGDNMGGVIGFLLSNFDKLPQIVSNFTKNLPVIIQAIVGVIQQIAKDAPVILVSIVSTIKQNLPVLLGGLTQVLKVVFTTLVPALIKGLADILPVLISALLDIFTALIGLLPILLNALISALPIIIDSLIMIFTAIIDALPIVLEGLVGMIEPIINGIVGVFLAIVTKLPQIIQSIIKLLPVIIKALVTVITKLVPHLPTIVKALISAIIILLPMLIKEIIKLIPVVIGALVKVVTSVGKTLLETIGAILKGIFNTLKSLGSAIWQPIKRVASGIWDFVKKTAAGIWEAVKNTATGIWNAVKNAATGIWDTIKNTVIGIWDYVLGKLMVALIPILLLLDAGNNNAGTVKMVQAANQKLRDHGGSGYGISGGTVVKLAAGGIVNAPTYALVGQEGPEAVIPLSESQYFNSPDVKDNRSFAGMQALLESIQGAANKPIQVILNVDGRKIAEAVANNTTPSYNLG